MPSEEKMKEQISQFDKMTKTPIEKLIISLSIPTIISMLVSNIYNMVDTAFVGTLGNSASGAVGIVFGFMAILQAIGFLFGQGAGSIISRRLGQKDVNNASKVAATGFYSAFALSLIAVVICWIFLDSIVYFLGSTQTIAPYAKTYIYFILATAPFQVTSFTLNNILRYEGKAFFGMVGLMSGAILNIAGDAIFMFGMDMGISGAGLSTAISQIVSFVILLLPFIQGRTQCKLTPGNIEIKGKMILNIISTGAPSLIRQGLNSIATILLNFLSKPYGDEAIAGMSIVSRIFFFIFSIAIGVGQGFQPVSGFNFGAKKYSRVRKAYKFTVILSEVLMLVFGTIIFIVAPVLVRLFRDDDLVVQIATRALRFQCVAILFLPMAMSTEMLFQSTGKKVLASLFSALRNGLIFIPLLYVLAKLQGLEGIEVAQAYAFILAFIPTVFVTSSFFRKLPKYDGIILDIDGTIWNTTEIVADAWNEAIEKSGIKTSKVTADILKKEFGKTMDVIAMDLWPELEEKQRASLLEECCKLEQQAVKSNTKDITYANVISTIQKLSKKIDFYIVSNCHDGYIQVMLKKTGLESYVKDGECFGRTGLQKDENITLLCQRNNIENPVYVGDTQGDCNACKKAKVPFIFAAYGFGSADSFVAKLNSFEELEKHI